MITKIGASEQYPKTTGQIRVVLRDLLMEKSITRFRLHTLTGIKYEVIDRYYRSENVIRVDLPLLAEICDALNCDISDILKYERYMNTHQTAVDRG